MATDRDVVMTGEWLVSVRGLNERRVVPMSSVQAMVQSPKLSRPNNSCTDKQGKATSVLDGIRTWPVRDGLLLLCGLGSAVALYCRLCLVAGCTTDQHGAGNAACTVEGCAIFAFSLQTPHALAKRLAHRRPLTTRGALTGALLPTDSTPPPPAAKAASRCATAASLLASSASLAPREPLTAAAGAKLFGPPTAVAKLFGAGVVAAAAPLPLPKKPPFLAGADCGAATANGAGAAAGGAGAAPPQAPYALPAPVPAAGAGCSRSSLPAPPWKGLEE